MSLFFDDADLIPRKATRLKALPPIPETGWRAPTSFLNLSAATALSLDVETFDPELTTGGPGWARGRGHIVGASIGAVDRLGNRGKWYFPIRHEVEPQHNLNPAQVFPWLKYVLENNLPKVGANLLYDIGWLAEEGIYVNGQLNDVQFAEAILDADAKVALDVLSEKYLGEGKETNILYEWIRAAYSPNEKALRAEIYRSPPRLVGPYGEADADLPLRILPLQLQELERQELTQIFRLECDLIPLLVRMRREGVTVDVAKAEIMKDELEKETIELYKRVEAEHGFKLESCSTADLVKLFNHLGLQIPAKKASRKELQKNPDAKDKVSFEKEILNELEHPIGDLIVDIREHEKICGTFLQSYIIEKNVDGKVFPQFHPLKGDKNGTVVGRFASSDPNLQNIPSRTKLGKKVRQIFTPDYGHAFWQKNDYSQIHYRILAHYAVDDGDGTAELLRQRYINDPATDYHMYVYEGVAPFMGWSLTDKAEIKDKRRPVKNMNFGLLYGQSESSLSYKAGMSRADGKTFSQFYHKAAPYVKPTMKLIGQEVQEFGFVRTILGRRIRFNLWEPQERGWRGEPLPYERAIREFGSNIKRAYEYRGVNYKFQGSEPDIVKTGMLACYRSGVYDFTGVPRITVHDETDHSVRDNSPQMQEAFRFIQHTMQTAIPLRIPVKVDVSTGPNWGLAD
jgi:DNA polymerase-1